MKRRLARFWYRFKNWFRTKPGPGEPLRFLCGSEEELRRVTTWACHINPDVFAKVIAAEFEYVAQCKTCKGFHSQFDISREAYCKVHGYPADYLERWGTLILKHNQFTGTQWERIVIKTSPCSPAVPVYGFPCYREIPAEFIVRIHPPSAHERAEALLALSEWLDGKVSEQEKRELLQLPDDVEI